ncbi:TPA: hypothetical protein SMI40_003461 [Serratia liquefaciens]|nr:hypothetical protein [Serratia liquefaciens]
MNTIGREARTTSGRGLGFQRTRAVYRLLTLIKKNGNKPVYCATEFIEDSLTLVPSENGLELGLEENKNYSSGLSYNSDEIKNTLVAFADQYINFFADSATIDFSVFCLAKLAAESIENAKLAIWVPSFTTITPKKTTFNILCKLHEKKELTTEEIIIAKQIFLGEYIKQYSVYSDKEKKELKNIGGNYHKISSWDDDEFYKFLKSVNFIFNDISDDVFESQVIEEIKNCEFYNYKLQGMERVLLSVLENTFDKRQQNEPKFSRFVSRSDVENIYLKIAANSEEYKPLDPSWLVFSKIEIDDQRNLKKKYEDVCSDITMRKINRLSLKASCSRESESVFENEYVSLRCQIFQWCSEHIEEKCISDNYSIDFLDGLLDDMVDLCYNKLTDLKRTYKIRINDKESLKGIILSLIDDCYLAYDE